MLAYSKCRSQPLITTSSRLDKIITRYALIYILILHLLHIFVQTRICLADLWAQRRGYFGGLRWAASHVANSQHTESPSELSTLSCLIILSNRCCISNIFLGWCSCTCDTGFWGWLWAVQYCSCENTIIYFVKSISYYLIEENYDFKNSEMSN